MLAAIIAACVTLFSPSPYTVTSPVVHAGHGQAHDTVYVEDMCRGHARDARILAVTDNGGEESEPAVIHRHHWTFTLMFGPGDIGTWHIVSVVFTCQGRGGWGSYSGEHPRIEVVK